MAQPASEDRPILHFTHVSHLSRVIVDGAVLADSIVGARLTHEVGDRGVKANRRVFEVTCGPEGHPCDYVPFYFAPKSPMLFKIAIGGVEQYQDGQDPLVYLVSSIGSVVNANLDWVFSDGNCGARLTEYFDDLALLDSVIDWPLMRSTMWNNTADDPTRATRRAAEFLVHQKFPWELVRGLVTRTEDTAEVVRGILDEHEASLPVTVRSAWYYNGSRYR